MDRGTTRWGEVAEPSARPIHGRHPLVPGGGAAVDAEFATPSEAERTAEEWRDRAGRLAAPVGLGPATARVTGTHVTLVLPSPPDLRELATIVLDQAVGAATVHDLAVRADLPLRHLHAAAWAAGVPMFHDHVEVVVGFGAGARRFDRGSLPDDPDEALVGVRPIPIVRVGGTNGKTTTANLLAAIAIAAGEVPGVVSTDGARVGTSWLPGLRGASAQAVRAVGRDPRVTLAIIETSRSTLMRRGLMFDHADVGVVTNVGPDHLGDWGLDTEEALGHVDLTVAEGLRHGGALVTTGDDALWSETLASWSPSRPDLEIVRFSTRRPAHGWADDRDIHVAGLDLPIEDLPLTLGGAARYHVDNALAAALAARVVGLGADAVEAGLRSLRPTATDNPGRGNLYMLRGARVIVDNVGNPTGMRRLLELVRRLDGDRLTLMFGLAIERPPAVIRELGLAAAALDCMRYVLKPLPPDRRSPTAEPGADVAVLRAALDEAGVGAERITVAPTERDALRTLIDGLAPGDLALALVHHDLPGALRQLDAAGAVPS